MNNYPHNKSIHSDGLFFNDGTQPSPSSRKNHASSAEKRIYRHELKYYINQGEAFLLEQRLRATMDRDSFVKQSRGYFIRSLYFDDMDNTSVYQKMAGIENREKYRIRIYGLRDDNIKLECKEKRNNYICKRTLQIDRATCDALCAGDPTPLRKYKEPLALEMYIRMSSEKFQAAVLVDYWRKAYISPIESIRITLDRELRTGYHSTDLFSQTVPTISVMDEYDIILEVKFNDYLPDYFHRLIQIGSSQRSAISKYVFCRQFE